MKKRRFPNVPFVLVDCCIVDDVIEENYHEIKLERQFNEVNCSFIVRNKEARLDFEGNCIINVVMIDLQFLCDFMIPYIQTAYTDLIYSLVII